MVKGASGQLLREHTQNCSLVCSFCASTSALMQPRWLSRAAGKLCRKHAWNAPSKQRHVPEAKQVLPWKGWVLKQRLNDVQAHLWAAATRAHVEPPLCTELFVDSCSVRHQGNCSASTRAVSPPGSPSAHKAQRDVHATRLLRSHATSTLGSRSVRKETCSGEKTAAFSRREHTWISFRARTDMFMRQLCCIRTPQAHLDLSPCAKKHVLAKRLLHSHAGSTVGSLSVRKKTCSCSGEKIAAFSRRGHTWISLRTQARRHVHATDCCVRTP